MPACKSIPTMRRTRLYAEVSPADTPKRRIYPSFFMRVSRRAKLNRGDPFGVSVDAEGCGFARREEECLLAKAFRRCGARGFMPKYPRRTHQKDGFIRLFLCVSAAVRSSTEGTPSGCRLTLKVAGSPDARRNACPKKYSDNAAHKALCRSIPSPKNKARLCHFSFYNV